MTPRRAPVAVSLLLLLGLLAATPLPGRAASPVILAEVTQETFSEQATLSGTALPARHADLSPKVDGLVTELFVDEGTLVREGDPILALDDRLAAQDVAADAARVQEAEAGWRDAVRVRDELRELKRGRHASEAEMLAAEAQVDRTAALLAAARASLARSEELKRRHRLRAPFDGMIVAKHAEVGEWVKRDEAAVELVALDRLRIRATLPQAAFARVQTGAAARVRFDALPDRTFTGEVFARVASGDERSRTFPVLIDLPNPDRLLAPGMSARVAVDLTGGGEEPAGVLTVPRDAVILNADGSRDVWRVQVEDGVSKAYPVRVTVGRAAGDRLEVTGGDLAAGDQVVVLGNERLEAGQTVEPREAPPATAAVQ
jgi:RND family efflux transporter MFP subunit